MGIRRKELIAWRGMINRCCNEKQKSFIHYGGRGIKVCEEWRGANGFAKFMQDMGDRPEGGTLERINNDGDYEPSNCRWATRQEQALNKRNTRYLSANGVTKPLAEWARDLKCQPAAILHRLKSGMTEQEAVTVPIPERPNSKLTADQARYVKQTYPEKSAQKLADELKVSKKTILNIIHGVTFADV